MRLRRLALKAACTAAVLLLLVGCGGAQSPVPTTAPVAQPSPAPAPTATPAPTIAPAAPTEPAGSGISQSKQPDGTVRYEKKDDGFAVVLPESWLQVDVRPNTFQQGVDEVSKQNPEFSKILSGQLRALEASNIRFFAYDQVPDALAEGYITNVNVIKQDLGMEIPLTMLVPASVKQLEGLGNVRSPIATRMVRVKSGDAAQLRYRLTLKMAAGGDAEIAIVQYMVVDSANLYVVSMGTLQTYAEKYLPLFQQIGESLEIVK